MIGKTISHYRIIEKLGGGGMGIVYKAHDTKLDRFVALKFLPPYLAHDSEEKQRFVREAKAASALDHPNICTVYETGESKDGQSYIAMAFYEGQTLKEKIRDNELKIDEIIDIVIQVAHGLKKAHENNIIHRDIKPANIIITNDGTAKIVDFGLAKLQGQTLLTKTGTTMGTVAYMSPEQINGEEVDQRTDIWSLGVVLYEMLSGQLPFSGEYEQAIMYSIVNKEPDQLELFPQIGINGFQSIIYKILSKDVNSRYKDIAELISDISLVKDGLFKTIKQTKKPKVNTSKKKKEVFIIFGLVLLVIAVVLTYIYYLPPVENVFASHVQITTTGKESLPEISPDGKRMAFLSHQEKNLVTLKIRELKGDTETEIIKSKLVGYPRWSPDGSELLFSAFSDSLDMIDVYLYSIHNDTVKRMPYRPGASFVTWSPDGSEFASTYPAEPQGIWYTDKLTGEIDFVSLKEKQLEWIYGIDWSPVGDRILVLIREKQGGYAIWTMLKNGDLLKKIISDSSFIGCPRWSLNGDVIYYLRRRAQTLELVKAKINPDKGILKQPSLILVSGLKMGEYFSWTNDRQKLLYTREFDYSNLWLVTMLSSKKKSYDFRQITEGTSLNKSPSISPDGQWVAFSNGIYPKTNIFTMPVQGGKKKQITFLDSYNDYPVWSPDGEKIAFGSTTDDKPGIWFVEENIPQPKKINNTVISPSLQISWQPGVKLLYQKPGNRNFYITNIEKGVEKLLVQDDSPGWMFSPRYSPNGKLVAVYWNRFNHILGRSETGLWIVSLQDSSQKYLSDGFLFPVGWAPNGESIYAADLFDDVLMEIPVETGHPKKLFDLPGDYYEGTVSNDGKKFVFSISEINTDIWMMENFDPEVQM